MKPSSHPTSPDRRRLVRAASALPVLAAAGPRPAAAQGGWRPTQTIVYTVPAGPGGSLDQSVRMVKSIAERLKLTDRPITVENKPGGAGRIALAALDQNPGNPHFLTVITYSLLTNHLLGELPTGHRDYAPLGMLFGEYVTVSVRADSPVRDATDLVERLKRDPTALSLGVATSIGNHIHVGAARPLKAAGVDIRRMTVVPYRSSQESLTNLLGGHLDVMAATTPNILTQLQAGKIRTLAVASRQRLQGPLAQIPTWRELGVPADYESAQGVMTSKGIPPEALAYWDRFFQTVTAEPEWKEFVASRQWEPRALNAADTVRELERAYADTRSVLEDLGLVKR
jgi:putative tricarboxylic transport membrane protein